MGRKLRDNYYAMPTVQKRIDKKLPICHNNGTVSYYNHARGVYLEHVFNVPEDELDKMSKADRKRVVLHLGIKVNQ